jgi:serine protease AprX
MTAPPPPTGGAAPDPRQAPEPFDPRALARHVISAPLAEELERAPEVRRSVVVDLNIDHVDGRAGAWTRLLAILEQTLGRVPVLESAASSESPRRSEAEHWVRRIFDQYAVIGGVNRDEIQRIAALDETNAPSEPVVVRAAPTVGSVRPAPRTSGRAIYRIWPNFRMSVRTTKSVATVKADAAHSAFAAFGEGIVWAVLDSGIDGSHAHFQLFRNLDIVPGLHRSFVTGSPLQDGYGHGTHVAGIIAGAAAPARSLRVTPGPDALDLIVVTPRTATAAVLRRPDPAATSLDAAEVIPVSTIAGMAPRAGLVSLKVLDDTGSGTFADVLAAIEYIQETNGYGRHLIIHGVNLSAGYSFDAAWFACGQSPLCVEIDRLVRSGVVVVVAAGNDGYGAVSIYDAVSKQVVRSTTAGLSLTINDPGNADLAITVGSTHREMPHVYGISYFSSKGPTGDGRLKPDLVAPGERIISCAAANSQSRANVAQMLPAGAAFDYVEDSGTSMAAPHVSGVIAAFLSVRREYIGRPERVKEIFLETAVDLKRERYFQGAGLVDLMRALEE